ncbi:MAG: alkaline phosphatase family protein [Candidatus Micrarchaeaceae archaeon]
MLKYLLVVLDGAPDRPNPTIGNETPLEHAKMHNLNKLARYASMGSMYTVAKGIAPESDSAVFSLLSYDVKHYTGRGPLEALGSGLKIYSNTLALRANFATIDRNRNIIDRRAGRNVLQSEAKELEKSINSIRLNENVKFKFKATVGHRGVVAFYPKGINLSANVSNGDIGYVRKGSISIAVSNASNKMPVIRPFDKSISARFTAHLLNEFIGKVITKLASNKVNEKRRNRHMLEANALLIRDAGVGLPNVKPISKKFGMKFAFITEMPVETGIARLLGMKRISSTHAKNKGKNSIKAYAELARLVLANANACEFMYVHIKGPDEPGHDGDAIEKSRRLAEIDTGFFANLNKILNDNVTLCVTADHSTPCALKAHSSDPVPVMIYNKSCKDGDGMQYNEKIGSSGSLGVFEGKKLISKIIEYKC